MDEELREAATRGDVKFLRKCVADNKPNQYYLTVFEKRDDEDGCFGNMFHIAAREEQEEFIREAIEVKLLDDKLVQQLLCQLRFQQQQEDGGNPLHVAARVGNVNIVKMFLNAFDPINQQPPWLQQNEDGHTPCHLALLSRNEECGLEILRMDKEKLSIMRDHRTSSVLYHAVSRGLDKVAMEILKSTHSFTAYGANGGNALHVVSNCSSSEKRHIFRLLLEKKKQKLIEQTTFYGSSIFNEWASEGKIWPFECFLESGDIIPDVKKVFVKLISATDDYGANPFHALPMYSEDKEGAAQIGKFLIQVYKDYQHEVDKAHESSNFPARELQYPWLVQDEAEQKTPLDYAMEDEKEEFAKMILSEDKNVLKTCQKSVLFVGIEKRLDGALLKILDIMADEEGFTHLLTNDQKLNVLHLAPKCNEEFLKRLLKQHSELIDGIDKEGETILHKWAKMNEVWPFEELVKTSVIDPKWKSQYVRLMKHRDNNNGNNPLHVAATCSNTSTIQIVKILVNTFQELYPSRIMPSENEKISSRAKNKDDGGVEFLPWCAKNKKGEGALHLAIRCQQDQQLAKFLLSLHQTKDDDHTMMTKLLDYYAPKEHKILFLATEKLFYDIIDTILARINKASKKKYFKDSSTGKNILHHASSTFKNNKTAGEQLVKWLVEEESEFINDPDKEGITPFCQATVDASSWIIDVMLQKDPDLAFKSPNEKPEAWVMACERGHLSLINTFIKHCPENFSGYCIRHQNSPLHHIKLPNSMEYEEFFRIPYIKDLINVQDSQKKTPLHKAIENENILFAEALLNMDKTRYDIKDAQDKTAIDLLEQVNKKQPTKWGHIYKGIEPFLATSYFQKETDLSEVRNTFSVVAALLATITFTAGFTLPGGLNEDNGQAKLATKAAFSVFIISNTLAMCFSMVVLICLIWSVIFERSKSIYLIDRSVRLLIASIYMTLLAFVSGVYLVISPKSFWAAILVVAMCALVLISAKRNLLYKVFTLSDKLLSFAKEKCIDPINCMERGLCQCGKNS